MRWVGTNRGDWEGAAIEEVGPGQYSVLEAEGRRREEKQLCQMLKDEF